jgi:glyoxylase-like metal-dependent hydrolase (beta-lactamase superfamily II)
MNKSEMTYRFNFGEVITLIGYTWYVEGVREKILVDGGGSVEYLSKVRGIPAREIQPLDSGLSKLGISFDDIDLIIATQLHHDHIAQASRFPKAKVLVQRAELEFARKAHPLFASLYVREFFDRLNFEVIDGDAEISEGISLLSTPGHSPGGQSVSIKTAQGTAVIAGLCTISENFEPPSPIKEIMPVIAPGIHADALKAYDSLLRIKGIADIVIPLHEPEFRHKDSIP